MPVVCSSVYDLCAVDEYVTLRIPFSVHASSMFIPGGVVGDGARPRAVLTADTRNTAHKKDPPIFFAPPCSTKQHGWSTDTRCAIRLFLRLMRERVTSLPLPHQSAVTTRRGGGLPADLDMGPFNLGYGNVGVACGASRRLCIPNLDVRVPSNHTQCERWLP